jgi:class 3 adenylate cyclase
LRDFKGAKLARNAGATVEIYTGTTAIAIFGPRKRAEDAVRLLRPVSEEEPAKALPPPAQGSLTGDFDCR